MANYNGLLRTPWPGTWSSNSAAPVALDTDLRGSLQTLSGNVGERLTDIPGPRCQQGMLVYLENSYTVDSVSRDAGKYYTYKLLNGQTRSAITGAVPNTEANWEEAKLGVTSDPSQQAIGIAFSAYSSVQLDLAVGTTVIKHDTIEYDTANYYDKSTGYFKPTVAGYYHIDAHISVASYVANSITANNSIILIAINKNGAEIKRGDRAPCNSAGNGISVSAIVYLDGMDDYCNIAVYQSTTATQKTEASFAFGALFSASYIPTANMPAAVLAEYFIVGGGGGGGYGKTRSVNDVLIINGAGGGGGGGITTGKAGFLRGGTYNITIGEGGAGSTSSTSYGSNGGNSSITGPRITLLHSSLLMAYGGGGGGTYVGSGGGASDGRSGGSCGGGAADYYNRYYGSDTLLRHINNEYVFQQYGTSLTLALDPTRNDPKYSGGPTVNIQAAGCGGSGAGEMGGRFGYESTYRNPEAANPEFMYEYYDVTFLHGGNGGAGYLSSITGTPKYYAAGGGGGGGYQRAAVKKSTASNGQITYKYFAVEPGNGGTQGSGNDYPSAGKGARVNIDGSPYTATAGGFYGCGGGGGAAYKHDNLDYNNSRIVDAATFGTAELANGAAGAPGVVILRMLIADFNRTTVTGSPGIVQDGDYAVITWTQNGSITI